MPKGAEGAGRTKGEQQENVLIFSSFLFLFFVVSHFGNPPQELGATGGSKLFPTDTSFEPEAFSFRSKLCNLLYC